MSSKRWSEPHVVSDPNTQEAMQYAEDYWKRRAAMKDLPKFYRFVERRYPSKRHKKMKTFYCIFYIGQSVTTSTFTGTVVDFITPYKIVVKPEDKCCTFAIDPFNQVLCCQTVPEEIVRASDAQEYADRTKQQEADDAYAGEGWK